MKCGHVVVGGRPNVGKSTLFNQLLGKHLSIVTPKRSTTRYSIRGILNDKDSQMVLVDTPGWQQKNHTDLSKQINATASSSLPYADLGVLVVEAKGLQEEDEKIVELFGPQLPLIVAINKVDLLRDRDVLLSWVEKINSWRPMDAIVPISAKKGDGCNELMNVLDKLLPEADPMFPVDKISDRNDSFFIADFIREQVFIQMKQELPYTAAIEIKLIERRKNGVMHIKADILVDTVSRKAMFIGAKASKLKMIGTDARRVIEGYLNTRIFLDLQVKHKANWTKEPAYLARLGIEGGIV